MIHTANHNWSITIVKDFLKIKERETLSNQRKSKERRSILYSQIEKPRNTVSFHVTHLGHVCVVKY